MVEFKKATAIDIPIIRKLAEQSWNSAYATILSPKQIEYMLMQMYSEEEISAQMQNPHYHYYIILKEGVEAGFIGFQFHYEKDTTKLHRIYLLEEYKGKGLGKRGLQFIKEKVSAYFDSRIILNVNKDNPAKQVYESQGFTVFHEEVFDIGNGFVMDDYLMEFKL